MSMTESFGISVTFIKFMIETEHTNHLVCAVLPVPPLAPCCVAAVH